MLFQGRRIRIAMAAGAVLMGCSDGAPDRPAPPVDEGRVVTEALGGCQSTLHHAGMFTATAASSYDGSPCNSPKTRYYGWQGVNGIIYTPASFARMDPAQDHQNGWLGMVLNNSHAGMQIGWYRGTIGCGSTFMQSNDYHMYVELIPDTTDPSGCGVPGYRIIDLGALKPGEGIIYRINYHAASKAWLIYHHYNTLAFTVPATGYFAPTSGAAEVENEVVDNSGTANMAPSTFGSPLTPSNAELRLLAGSGAWVPWSDHIIQFTATHQESTGSHSASELVVSKKYSYLQTHGL